MRLEMPDGTSVILVPGEDGVVVGTQGAKLVNGDRPLPSGLLVTGEDAELLAALVGIIEDVEVEEVLGADDRG